MTEVAQTSPSARESLSLKLAAPAVSPVQPWADDVLDRQQLSARLTNLIQTQSAPFTISIHGNWGTGKTFLLQRWQKDLETQSFKAIYFNAWEDDFCNDPLLAILGQLADYLKGPALSTFANKAIDVALPLLQQNLIGVLNKTTGITLELPDSGKSLVDQYLGQRATKDRLRQSLASLSEAVVKETGHPLVFIIDELDRCRPTFAVELLEKVKHIFDIQSIVFVFGINRDQLCISLQSEYGRIDAETYLRRFFDIELTLPDADTEAYCRHVMDKFGLDSFFSSLSAEANANIHIEEYRGFQQSFPQVWGRLGLSLRDIDYCVGMFAMLGRNLAQRHYMFPAVLGLMIPLKLKNAELYRRFVQRKCFASEVIDYFDKILAPQQLSQQETSMLDYLEANLYFAEDPQGRSTVQGFGAVHELELLASGAELTAVERLSKRIRTAEESRIQNVLQTVRTMQTQMYRTTEVIEYLVRMIDLHQSLIRR